MAIKDVFIGILFSMLGIFFSLYSLNYDMGTAMQIGPGFFPLLISLLLIFVGLLIVARAIFWKH